MRRIVFVLAAMVMLAAAPSAAQDQPRRGGTFTFAISAETPTYDCAASDTFATLHFGLRHPRRATALVTAGIGSGAPRDLRARFQSDSIAAAARFEREGSKVVAEAMAVGPARVQLQNMDPRGWEEEKRYLAEHSAKGSALTVRGLSWSLRKPTDIMKKRLL